MTLAKLKLPDCLSSSLCETEPRRPNLQGRCPEPKGQPPARGAQSRRRYYCPFSRALQPPGDGDASALGTQTWIPELALRVSARVRVCVYVCVLGREHNGSAYTSVSQPRHDRHFGLDDSLLWGPS